MGLFLRFRYRERALAKKQRAKYELGPRFEVGLQSVTRGRARMILALFAFFSSRPSFEKNQDESGHRDQKAHHDDRHNWHEFLQRHVSTFRYRSSKTPAANSVALIIDVTKSQSPVKVARWPITRSIGTKTAVSTAASRRKSPNISRTLFLFSTA
jgi:hypothetical protein